MHSRVEGILAPDANHCACGTLPPNRLVESERSHAGDVEFVLKDV